VRTVSFHFFSAAATTFSGICTTYNKTSWFFSVCDAFCLHLQLKLLEFLSLCSSSAFHFTGFLDGLFGDDDDVEDVVVFGETIKFT